jgi:hypothetical protein
MASKKRPAKKTQRKRVAESAAPPPPARIEDKSDEALGRMLRLAEGNTMLLLSSVLSVSEGCMQMVKSLRQAIDEEKAMTVRDRMLVLTRWSNLVQKGVDAARDMAEIKRHLLGEAATRQEAAAASRGGSEPQPPTALEAAMAELASPGGAYRLTAARHGVVHAEPELELAAEPVART